MYDRKWDASAEAALIHRLQDILLTVRPQAKSLRLVVEVEVVDPGAAILQVRNLLGEVPPPLPAIGPHSLSLREIEVLGLIMQGHSNAEIAERLFISYETVKSHRKNILSKTGARNVASLIHHYRSAFFDK